MNTDPELNILGTLNGVYSALRTIHVCGDTDVIALGDVFRGLYAVIQKLAAEQISADGDGKGGTGEVVTTPPHKRKEGVTSE